MNLDISFPGIQIYCSATTSSTSTSCMSISYESQSRVVKCHPELEYSTLEEADVRIMPHLIHCADTGHAGSVLLSSDTDVLVLAMYHWKVFKMHGLQV